jgi:hypothetical protein
VKAGAPAGALAPTNQEEDEYPVRQAIKQTDCNACVCNRAYLEASVDEVHGDDELLHVQFVILSHIRQRPVHDEASGPPHVEYAWHPSRAVYTRREGGKQTRCDRGPPSRG